MTTMEDLTKTQIVLLTLLVSFITSIATGIITTSLLAQAPATVTETINRVVERTVERPATQGEAVREVTIVKEGDAIVGSIDNGAKSLVRIKSPSGEFYALGVVVSKFGHVLSDRRDLSQTGPYSVTLSDGTSHPAIVVKASDTGSMVLFKIQTDDAFLRTLTPITLSRNDPKLGQTVIALEGSEKNVIAVGRILSLDPSSGMAQTDIPIASETQGGPLMNLSGELVGLKTSNADLTIPPSTYTVVTPLAKFVDDNS
jgi:S1-C subfamily serine protease